MKKLMITAAIVCAAAFANAASIAWGGDIAYPDTETPVAAGSVAYLIYGTTAEMVAVTEVTVAGSDWSSWTTDTGAKIVSSYTLDALEAETNYRFDASYNITGASDVGYYSVVVVDGQAGAAGLKGAYAYAGQNTLNDPTSGATVDLTVGDGWSTFTAPFIGEGGFESVSFTESVPEPTSGLLLLLGMAGLALKRKQA